MATKKFKDLTEGEAFRFTHDSESTIRIAVQVGRTEIYAPHQNSNPFAGEEEVYLKSDKDVILIAE